MRRVYRSGFLIHIPKLLPLCWDDSADRLYCVEKLVEYPGDTGSGSCARLVPRQGVGGVGVVSREGVRVEDVSVLDVWSRLEADPGSVLIDVRTRAEWAYVGLPDISRLGKQVVLLEWQSFPDRRIDPGFVTKLQTILSSAGVESSAELFFICRSGGRSRMAAEVMVAAGYPRCRNVTEGFEGPLDSRRHRGRVSGWKVAGLPWVQG